MADHMQDEADLEALKRWWDENGKGLVGAAVIAVLGTLGWQQYERYSASQDEAASDLYATMLAIQLEEGDPDQMLAIAATLKAEHSGSTYAQFAAMLEARVAVEADDLAAAESALRWALSAGDARSDIGQLIQLRLARVLAAQGAETEALAHQLDLGAQRPVACQGQAGLRVAEAVEGLHRVDVPLLLDEVRDLEPLDRARLVAEGRALPVRERVERDADVVDVQARGVRSRVDQALGHDQIVGRIGENREAVLDELTRRLDQSEHVRLQRVVVADDLELDPVRAEQVAGHLRQIGRAHV